MAPCKKVSVVVAADGVVLADCELVDFDAFETIEDAREGDGTSVVDVLQAEDSVHGTAPAEDISVESDGQIVAHACGHLDYSLLAELQDLLRLQHIIQVSVSQSIVAPTPPAIYVARSRDRQRVTLSTLQEHYLFVHQTVNHTRHIPTLRVSQSQSPIVPCSPREYLLVTCQCHHMLPSAARHCAYLLTQSLYDCRHLQIVIIVMSQITRSSIS